MIAIHQLRLMFPPLGPNARHNELYLRAADIIEKLGWARYALYDTSTGAVCVMGAFGVAVNGNPNNCPDGPHVAALAKLLELPPSSQHASSPERGKVVNWNNRICTSADDVIQGLRRAAAKLAANPLQELL